MLATRRMLLGPGRGAALSAAAAAGTSAPLLGKADILRLVEELLAQVLPFDITRDWPRYPQGLASLPFDIPRG